MAIELRWKIPLATTCLHLADGLSSGWPLVVPQLAESVGAEAAGLKMAIDASGAPPGRLWRHLAGMSGMTDTSRHIAETALAKTIGRGERYQLVVGDLATAVSDLQSAVRIALPKLGEELALRERPLREQWEARGPGLLFQLKNLTHEELVPETAEVLLVHPAFGGGGAAHISYNAVRIEAVLANPHPELPEVVRLAWLAAQLRLALPAFSEEIQADRLPHVARLAMVPAVLAAAQGAELVQNSPELMRRAIEVWRLAVPPGLDAAAMLSNWWETYQLDHPPLGVALSALDQMLG
jgi:hypothetical protein